MGEKHTKKWVRDKAQALLDMPEQERIALIERMFSFLDKHYEQFAVVMFYIYGLRPEELLILTKDKFKVVDSSLIVKIPTLKGGEERTLRLSLTDTPYLERVVLPYLDKVQYNLFPFWRHTTNLNHIFRKIKNRSNAQIDLNPYVFRHFRMNYIASLGASQYDLKNWKGAKSFSSVEEYLHFNPVTKFEKAIR